LKTLRTVMTLKMGIKHSINVSFTFREVTNGYFVIICANLLQILVI
jgi:hypothetical protein